MEPKMHQWGKVVYFPKNFYFNFKDPAFHLNFPENGIYVPPDLNKKPFFTKLSEFYCNYRVFPILSKYWYEDASGYTDNEMHLICPAGHKEYFISWFDSLKYTLTSDKTAIYSYFDPNKNISYCHTVSMNQEGKYEYQAFKKTYFPC